MRLPLFPHAVSLCYRMSKQLSLREKASYSMGFFQANSVGRAQIGKVRNQSVGSAEGIQRRGYNTDDRSSQ